MSLKKLLLALPILMTGFAMDATADPTYGCNVQQFKKDFWQALKRSRNDNEFIYESSAYWDDDTLFKGLKCGHEGTKGCENGVQILMPSNHIFNSKVVPRAGLYTCHSRSTLGAVTDHYWSDAGHANVGECDSLNGTIVQIDGANYLCDKKVGNKVCVGDGNHKICRLTDAQLNCKQSGGSWKNAQCDCGSKVLREGKCVTDKEQECYDRHGIPVNNGQNCRCADDRVWNDAGQCVPSSQCVGLCIGEINMSDMFKLTGGNASIGDISQQQQQQQKNNSDNTNTTPGGGKDTNVGGGNGGSNGGGSSCLNRPTALGITCCKAGKATRYFGPKTKSELDRGVNMPESCICLDAAGKDDATKEFDMASLSCVAKGTPEPVIPVACNCTVDLGVVSSAESSCAAQSMATAIKQVRIECQKGANCNGQTVSVYVNAITEAMSSCANQSVEPEKPQLNEQRLAAAVEAIDKYRSGLDVSVWKDAEGNFNTARLVSDSIAGVVLGTAGGLITSSVVKKNQVKNGFEDVVCTIGGQTVGSYGDEISVGIQ